jgi:NADH-quinone oxidoreductase subunit C
LSSPEAPAEDTATETPEDEAPEEVVETDERRESLLAEVTGKIGADNVAASHVAPGQDLWVRVATPAWADLARVLRDLGFGYFTFLSAIDWMPSPHGRGMDAEVDKVLDGVLPKDPGAIEPGVTGGATRFEVFARVYSIERTIGLTLKTEVPDDSLTVETWTGTYAGADWHEREAWEMFGITFDGHPHLRHIYLPTEFEGNPLRKDFPLLARHMKPWPGIVDVEPMPGEDATDEDAAAGEGE